MHDDGMKSSIDIKWAATFDFPLQPTQHVEQWRADT
jgi:hypothetical protein